MHDDQGRGGAPVLLRPRRRPRPRRGTVRNRTCGRGNASAADGRRGTGAVKEPKRIESRIAGAFSGWQAGTRFTLENGQTWEAVSLTRFSAKLDSPKVVIEKDLIGQNQLSVEGYKDRTVVRRIETE